MNPAAAKREAKVSPVAAGWIKGIEAAARYAGVSEKIASRWVKAGHLRPRALSRRLHLFRPEDIDRAVEQAALAYSDSCPPENHE